jgi:hypothetical protein
MNHTLPSLRIGCREGFDGGLPQTFQLEVYENDELKTKVSNAKPNFDIAYVPSGIFNLFSPAVGWNIGMAQRILGS